MQSLSPLRQMAANRRSRMRFLRRSNMFCSHFGARWSLRSLTQGWRLKAVSELLIPCRPASRLHADAFREHELTTASIKQEHSLRSALASGGTGLNRIAPCIRRRPSPLGGLLTTVTSLSRRYVKTINSLAHGRQPTHSKYPTQ